MANSPPLLLAPNTLILKLKLHCTRCERKLKSLLASVQGVQSVTIDSKQGTVTISGNVDPETIITLLGILGRKAEVLWGQNPSKHNQQIVEQRPKVVELDNHHQQLNESHDVVAQLEQLSGMKNVKVTYSMTMEGNQKGLLGDKNLEITIRDGVSTPQISFSGGLCGGSTSCCGSHGSINRNLHQTCGCPCPIHAMAHPNWATHGYGCFPQGPPPPWPGYASPSAPPLGLVYDSPQASPRTPPPPPPPVMGYSYSSFLSDDNPAGGCSIF